MSIVILKVINDQDEPVGYVAHKEGTKKLVDTNLWLWDEIEELQAYVVDQNEREAIAENWPDANDAEVQELINDPEFEPFERVRQEVIDQKRLDEMLEEGLIPTHEENGYPEIVPGNEHLIPTTEELVPKDPRAPAARFRKACEQVALRRMGTQDA